MGSLGGCLKRLGFSNDEGTHIRRLVKAYRDDGVAGPEANVKAVEDLIRDTEQELTAVHQQIEQGAIDTTQKKEQGKLTKGQALFERQQKYGRSPELRPNEDAKKTRQLSLFALGDLDRAGDDVSTATGAVDRPGTLPEGVTTVALGISPDLIHQGVVDLKGYVVRNASDLAKLAQVYRNPRFETFRIIYLKGQKIVGHEGLTSRLPGVAKILSPGAPELTQMRKTMKALGADGYWMLHNHPSGNSTPSLDDAVMTVHFEQNLEGYQGHVVIDSGEYSFFQKDPVAAPVKVPFKKGQKDELLTPSIPHALLGKTIFSDGDVAKIGRNLQTPEGWVTVLYRDSDGATRAIQEIPQSLLENADEAGKFLKAQGVAFGSQSIFTYVKGARINPATIKTLIEDGYLMDHVEERGGLVLPARTAETAVAAEANRKVFGMTGEQVPSESVAEEQAPYVRAPINHLGTLTPDQEAALRHVHGDPKTWRDTLNQFQKTWKKELVQGLFDQYAPILDYSKKAYILARMSKAGDGTLEAMLMYGKPYVDADGAYRVDYSKEAGKKGFAGVLAKLDGEADRFLEWVAAQRAERLKGIGLEHLYRDTDIVALKSLNQGLMKSGRERTSAYAEALIQLNDWNASVLKIAEDSGLINAETRAMYEGTPYVPFYRLQDEGIVSGPGMTAGLVNQYAWKRLKGGTQHLNQDLLANVLQNWSHLITASAKNRAASATLDAAVEAGVAEEVSSKAGKDVVHYMVDGKERTMAVSDPALMDAIAALHYAGLGAIGKPFVTMKRWLAFGVTVNPAYKIRNLIRDSIQAIGTADISYNPSKNITQGLKALQASSEVRAQLLAGGGMIRFGAMLDGNNADRTRTLIEQGVHPDHILDNTSAIEKFWKNRILPVFEAYQEIGDRGEQINRAALYEQLTAKGMSHQEASFWARDLMDFSMSGKWGAVRVLTQVVPFMNARLQGIYKIGRATKQDYRRMATTFGAVALASIALLLAYHDDEDWKKREDWDRDNYWWFKVAGVAFRLPKPFEVGAMGTLAERSVELLISKEMTGTRFVNRIASTVANQLSMNPTPQLVKPLLDLYANKDAFTGRQIESMGMERLRKAERMTERTSEVAKVLGSLGLPDPTQLAMGRWDTLSPVQIDSLVKGYFSWLGSSTTTALDYGLRPMMDRGDRPAMSLKEVFLAGNFVETLPSNSSRYVTQLYEQAKEIEEAYGSYQEALRHREPERAKTILEQEKEKLRKYHMVEQVKRAESILSTQIRVIESSKTLSGEDKRTRIDRLRQRQNDLAKRLSPVAH